MYWNISNNITFSCKKVWLHWILIENWISIFFHCIGTTARLREFYNATSTWPAFKGSARIVIRSFNISVRFWGNSSRRKKWAFVQVLEFDWNLMKFFTPKMSWLNKRLFMYDEHCFLFFHWSPHPNNLQSV